VRKIIAWDLDRIESRADYLICYWDAAAARGGGTQGELFSFQNPSSTRG
jgi:hypothetical protein